MGPISVVSFPGSNGRIGDRRVRRARAVGDVIAPHASRASRGDIEGAARRGIGRARAPYTVPLTCGFARSPNGVRTRVSTLRGVFPASQDGRSHSELSCRACLMGELGPNPFRFVLDLRPSVLPKLLPGKGGGGTRRRLTRRPSCIELVSTRRLTRRSGQHCYEADIWVRVPSGAYPAGIASPPRRTPLTRRPPPGEARPSGRPPRAYPALSRTGCLLRPRTR